MGPRLLRTTLLTTLAVLLSASAASAGGLQLTTLDLGNGPLTLQAGASVPRVCSAKLYPAGTAGVAEHTLTVGTAGLLNARLQGNPNGPDWDLAVFDAVTHKLLAGSDAFGGNELATAPIATGELLIAQACRYDGDADTVPMTLKEIVPSGAIPKADDLSLVDIKLQHGQSDVDHLQTLGIDLNETGNGGHIAAVLHSAQDGQKIRDLGLSYTMKVANLRAYDHKVLTDDALVTTRSGLPSGRTSYRHLVDYQDDLKALVAAHPGVVRKVVFPHLSIEGRTVEGVEIATGVDRTDDGRPTVYQLGLHHVREWPSGEVVMEYAEDLFTPLSAADQARKQRLLDGERNYIFPVINPDGLAATQLAGDYMTGDNSENATLALIASGTGSYRRKNCGNGVDNSLPDSGVCADEPGVDLNRNYGAFWGGPGESDDITSQTYRGPSPFSEPEVANFHEFSSDHVVNVINSNHTFAGDMLYQPGFNAKDEPGLPKGTKVPYQTDMKALSDAAAGAAGYLSEVSYLLYDVTGATEDWNYFAQGAFGYTTETTYDNFHPDYQDGVVDQYLGTLEGDLDKSSGRKVSKGLRESMLLEAEAGLNPRYHSEIDGTAPPGVTLRLRKSFMQSTSYIETNTDSTDTTGAAEQLPEHLDYTLTVGPSGKYTWAVGPSTRPVVLVAKGTEAYTMTCESAAGKVYETKPVTVAIGQTVKEDFTCNKTGTSGATGPSPTGPTGATPPVPTTTTTAPTTMQTSPATTTPPGTTTATTAPPTTDPALTIPVPETTTTTVAITTTAPDAPPAGPAGPAVPVTKSAAPHLAISRPLFSAKRTKRVGSVKVRVRLLGGTGTFTNVRVRIVSARTNKTLFSGRLARLSSSKNVTLKPEGKLSALPQGMVDVIVTATRAGQAKRIVKGSAIVR